MVVQHPSAFSKSGILLGAGFLTAEYLMYTLFYSYANPELWAGAIPHKYILYITLLLVTAVAFVVVRDEEKQKELSQHLRNFSDFRKNILWALGLSVFCTGTFIFYNIIQAKLFDSTVIGAFIDNNLYVDSASNWLNVINHIVYPVFIVFIFQGFFLNGLAKKIGFRESNIVTSLFYGFWFGDLLGATIYNLFLNLVYRKTGNIFYPIVMTVAVNLVFIAAYLVKDEIWFLRPDYPDYNKEVLKGVLVAIAMAPLAFKVVRDSKERRSLVSGG